MKIIFFGTPEFAIPSLDNLIQNKHEILAVVTSVDKPAGRNLALKESPIKVFALKNNIPILQPPNLKDPNFQKHLSSFKADLFVIVAFRMLPQAVWNMPPLGSLNLHASILPNYRGAAPINWAIINGETETGLTTFKLQHEIDTGELYLQKKIPITPTMNASQLHDILKQEGGILLAQTIEQIETQALLSKPQFLEKNSPIKSAPKLTSEVCELDFSKSCKEVYNHIRGLSEYPCAYTKLNNKKIKIYSCDYEFKNNSETIGKIITDKKTFLNFVCKDGVIFVKELQIEGKKKMGVKDFLNGYSQLLEN